MARSSLKRTKKQIASLAHRDPNVRESAWRVWWSSSSAAKLKRTARHYASLFDIPDSEDDIYQETNMVLFVKVVNGDFKPEKGSILGFARGITRICALDELEVAKKRPIDLPLDSETVERLDDGSFSESAVVSDRKETIDDAKTRLPEREQNALAMRYELGMSDLEIAEKLGVSYTNARQILYRARQHIREALGRGSNI